MTDLRQAAQQALEALDKLSKLGNGDCDGNSIGNSIAQKAREKLRTALAQEHAMHDLARLGQEIEQAEPISTNGAMRDARLNAGWGSEQQAEPVQEFITHITWDERGVRTVNGIPDDAPPEPTPWRDMVVVSLVREGINKHRARELADHFAAQPQQQQAEFDCPRCGHVCSQRQWVGLTPEEVKHLYPYGRSVWGRETFEAIEKALKDKNT